MSDQQINELLQAMEVAKKKATRSKEAAMKFLKESDILRFVPATAAGAKKSRDYACTTISHTALSAFIVVIAL